MERKRRKCVRQKIQRDEGDSEMLGRLGQCAESTASGAIVFEALGPRLSARLG
jgi:hypothetical protein